MVDATRNSVESGSPVHFGIFQRCRLIAAMCYFDAMSFCKQCAENLFSKVGINIFINGPLSAGGEYFANALWLNDCCINLRFHFGDFFAHVESTRKKFNNALVDAVDFVA